EALPGVVLVEPGAPGPGQDQGVGCLHEEGPGPAEQHGGLPVDHPRDRSWAEQAAVRRGAPGPHETSLYEDGDACAGTVGTLVDDGHVAVFGTGVMASGIGRLCLSRGLR